MTEVLCDLCEKYSGNYVIFIVRSLEQVTIAFSLEAQSKQKIDFE